MCFPTYIYPGIVYGISWLFFSGLSYFTGISLLIMGVQYVVQHPVAEISVLQIRILWGVEILFFCFISWIPIELVMRTFNCSIELKNIWISGLTSFVLCLWLLILSRPAFISSAFVYLYELICFLAVPYFVACIFKIIDRKRSGRSE